MHVHVMSLDVCVSTASPCEIGVDPNMDPELVLALRVSLEEERARQDTTVSARACDLCM